MTFKKLGLIMICTAAFAMAGMLPEEIGCRPGCTVRTLWAKSTAKTDSNHLSSNPSLSTSYRTITDMAGRRVTIPKTITKVLSIFPPPTTFIYMLAPDKLGGWLGRPSNETRKFIPPAYRGIPVLGWGRNSTNYEAFIAAQPDLVFIGCETGFGLSRVDLTQEKFGAIAVLCMTTDDELDSLLKGQE